VPPPWRRHIDARGRREEVVGGYSRFTEDELLRLTSDDREAFGEFYARHVRAILGELRRRGLATDKGARSHRGGLRGGARGEPPLPARGGAGACMVVRDCAEQAGPPPSASGQRTAARRKLGMARFTYSDEALDRVEELLVAAASVHTNGTTALPAAEREAVVARVIDERNYDEIAAASGATPAAIRQHVSRGLPKLARLGRQER
jgi:Sigma-70, region 4